jgi:hypothetical protein
MDEIKPITNQGFFSYVFKLSKFKQADLLNFIQYCILSIVPFILLYYFIKKYSLPITYRDSSLYILLMTFSSIMLFIVGIYFIDRIINYIPPLSGKFYDVINITNISIALIMTLLLVHNAGYFERTSILLSRFDVLFNRMLSLVGIKNPPEFDMFNYENNNYYYQLAFYKAKDKAIELGASNEKADEVGHTIVEKLKKIKSIQETTNVKQIVEISKRNSSKALGTSASSENSTSGLPDMKAQNSTSMTASSSVSSQNPTQYISTSGISMSNPYARKNEDMIMDRQPTNDPEPANSVSGGGFTAW